MAKNVTQNQLVGEIGETAAKLQFLKIGFQFDPRSRLEAGIDAIVEIMDHGRPLAKMIAVQVKTTAAGKYAGEDDNGFHYLLKSEDLAYWRGSNLPIIIVLHRQAVNRRGMLTPYRRPIFTPCRRSALGLPGAGRGC
ncbi:DUF4365 domain-containing protein, partial [Agrobacterium sp. 16-172Ci]